MSAPGDTVSSSTTAAALVGGNERRVARWFRCAAGLENPGWIFVDASAYADPAAWHAVAAKLRRESPVLRVELAGREPFWAITRHADVRDIERQSELFTNSPMPTLSVRRPPEDDVAPPVKTLVQMDGDEHRAFRGLINAWFKPGSVRRRADAVAALARRAVDAMAEQSVCDFAQDVANQFPCRSSCPSWGSPSPISRGCCD